MLRDLDKAAGFPFLEHSGAGSRRAVRLTAEGRQFIDTVRRFHAPLQQVIDGEFVARFRTDGQNLIVSSQQLRTLGL